jgi:DNA polymerase zeta
MAAIFYCLQTENDGISSNGRKEGQHCGIIAVQDPNSSEDNTDFRKLGLSRYPIEVVEDEIDLIKTLVDKVHEWDPEIFTGYDVLKDSWGYFVERVDEIGESSMRARGSELTNISAPELDIIMELSRVRSQSTGKRGSKAEDRWGYSKGATLKVTGRHILPVWRLLKSDVNLCLYSLENVVFHILRQR